MLCVCVNTRDVLSVRPFLEAPIAAGHVSCDLCVSGAWSQ